LQPLAVSFFLQLICFVRSEDVSWWITNLVVHGAYSCVARILNSQACQRVQRIFFFMAPGLVNQFFVFGGMSSMDQQYFMYI
jgi:hypothetical protein